MGDRGPGRVPSGERAEMTSVLLTAFEPYDLWTANSSWLTLVQLTHQLPSDPSITTRLYPVNFAAMKERLAKDLEANYDYALHLGQAPGSTRIQLESHAINIGGSAMQSPDTYRAWSRMGPWPIAVRCPWGLGRPCSATLGSRPKSRTMPVRTCVMRRCIFVLSGGEDGAENQISVRSFAAGREPNGGPGSTHGCYRPALRPKPCG